MINVFKKHDLVRITVDQNRLARTFQHSIGIVLGKNSHGSFDVLCYTQYERLETVAFTGNGLELVSH